MTKVSKEKKSQNWIYIVIAIIMAIGMVMKFKTMQKKYSVRRFIE